MAGTPIPSDESISRRCLVACDCGRASRCFPRTNFRVGDDPLRARSHHISHWGVVRISDGWQISSGRWAALSPHPKIHPLSGLAVLGVSQIHCDGRSTSIALHGAAAPATRSPKIDRTPVASP